MIKDLKSEGREDVESLSNWLKDRQTKFSPVQLAELAGLAFHLAFAVQKPENKLASALVRGISVRQQMALDEEGNQSTEETARLLGMTKQSVLNLYHAGKVLAWRTEKQGALRFPVWQFIENRRLPGLEEILMKLNANPQLDDWAKIGFFLQTHGMLNGRRPLDLLRENNLEMVLKAAQAYVE